ncbi:Fic family protein [Caballeronia sp. BR00000012568055]|uniref:Fic family protein n=1 Tax=Caballeronia sp. BR00000012568055 TaxID=2918761 RepID=UPI0023F91557|nr:Fic family protein [Caballeronia sp. BR00000012568055]
MIPVGYARLIAIGELAVTPPKKLAYISSSVNRRIDTDNQMLFPASVAFDDTPVGHLEFALRHEGVNLEIIDAAFEHIEPSELIERIRATPTGEHIRRACFLWEWLTGKELDTPALDRGGYVDLFPNDIYYTAPEPIRAPKYRVRNNALGAPYFCPTVSRAAIPDKPPLSDLLREAQSTLDAMDNPELYRRALDFLYLSETRGSYAIESETPSSDKQARFVHLLKRAGELAEVNEEWLVQLQNVIVRDVFSQEASYRTRQNWLENATGRIDFFPAPIDDLRRVMEDWEGFVNDQKRCPDVLVKAACSAFGFVYLHPFFDGNGRLHRFLIQHALARSGLMGPETVIPVSAVIEKNIPAYHAVLTAFSRPVTQLWNYRRTDADPYVLHAPGSRAYRFFNADREVAFLYEMIKRAVREEIPSELAWLRGYDLAFSALNDEFDIPRKDLSALIRMTQSNKGVLSAHRRKQYSHIPAQVMDRIEEVVRQSFAASRDVGTN